MPIHCCTSASSIFSIFWKLVVMQVDGRPRLTEEKAREKEVVMDNQRQRQHLDSSSLGCCSDVVQAEDPAADEAEE